MTPARLESELASSLLLLFLCNSFAGALTSSNFYSMLSTYRLVGLELDKMADSLSTTHEAYERVLTAADHLFAERGYPAVSLRNIAQAIGIRHASLYYHFPHGKEELYVAVMERRMQMYRVGLEEAIAAADKDWQEQLRAAALWLLEQPALHLGRMMQSDMPAISPESAGRLRVIIFESLLKPLEAVFRDAQGMRPEKQGRGATLAGMFLSLIEGIYNLPPHYINGSKRELVNEVLDVLANGLKS